METRLHVHIVVRIHYSDQTVVSMLTLARQVIFLDFAVEESRVKFNNS